MSRFNLNERSMMNGGFTVFNNGIAGKAENVKVEINKRGLDEPDSYPDYKVIFTDEQGSSVNQGFYKFNMNPSKDEEQNSKASDYLINRVLELTNALVPEGFVYPDIPETGDLVNDTNTALDILFKIANEHSGNKVNVFTTYGNLNNPKKYLTVRYFNYVEKAGKEGYSALKPKGDDLMEPVKADEPANTSNNTTSGNKPW